MPGSAIHVRGLAELQRALRRCERDVRLGVKSKLRDVAEPVRVEAERLAPAEIRNIGPAWSGMRTGVTTSVVYVAPKQRGRSRKRPNLFGLLNDRVLDPALQNKQAEVELRLELILDEILLRDW